MATEKTVKQSISRLARQFDVPEWSLERRCDFEDDLADLPTPLVVAAVDFWIRTRSERPTSHDIRRAAIECAEEAGAIPRDLMVEEFLLLIARARRKLGPDGRFPREKYPLAAEAIDACGGWHAVCVTPNQDTVRAQLRQAYAGLLAKRRTARLSAPRLALPGDAELLALQAQPIAPKALITEAPKPLSREEAKAALDEIYATLPPPDPEFVEPTAADLAAAARRKAELLAALQQEAAAA